MSTYVSPSSMRQDLVNQVTRALALRFSGWRADYIGTDDPPSPDTSVLSSGFAALDTLKSEPFAETQVADVPILQTLAHIFSTANFMSWSAHDPVTHTIWDPLLQSYQDFKALFPDAEPFLASPRNPDAMAQQLMGFFLQTDIHHE